MTIEEMTDSLKEYDYSACNRVLKENNTMWEDDNISSSLGNVLLIGATNFLGIHVFCELLGKQENNIYCLLSPNDNYSSLKEQLRTALMYYFGDVFDNAIDKCVIPVSGDITDAASLAALSDYPINTVINCAYGTERSPADNQRWEAVNYQGVANLLDLCRSKKWKLVHVSTTNVAGVCPKEDAAARSFSEKGLYVGQIFDSQEDYIRFKAECLLLEEAAKGVAVKIMRIGRLGGRQADGEYRMGFCRSNLVLELQKYVKTGLFPLGCTNMQVELSPVDCVASAILRLASTPDNMVVFHPYSCFTVNKGLFISTLVNAGYPIKHVPNKVFAKACAVEDVADSPYTPLNRNNDFTTAILYHFGIVWPLPTEMYVKRFIKMLDGMGVF